jgi:hypothetical protein
MAIDKSISILEQALNLTPDEHPKRAGCLYNLGNFYSHRFKCTKDFADIEKGISAHVQAVDIFPEGHTDKPTFLSNLSTAFTYRFNHSDGVAAISHLCRAAISSTGSPLVRFHVALEWARSAFKINDSSALQGYTVALDLIPRIA